MGYANQNKYDHKAFSASCIANNINAFYAFIRVHTIPNQSSSDSHHNVQRTPYRQKSNSGIKTGFTKVGYQSIIAERVTVPENKSRQVTTTANILVSLFILVFYLCQNSQN
jgi:hypothetical protein